MKNLKIRKLFANSRGVVAALFALTTLCASQAQAQVPGRFYLKSLTGGSAVPLIVESISGNTNPFDPSHIATPGASFDATMALGGYAETFSVMDRAAVAISDSARLRSVTVGESLLTIFWNLPMAARRLASSPMRLRL